MGTIIFYGTGQNARENYDRWVKAGLEPVCFVSRTPAKRHTVFMGKKVLSPLEAIQTYPDYVFYCTQSAANLESVYLFLRRMGIPEERIRSFEERGSVPAAPTAALYPQMYRIYQAIQDDLSREWFWARAGYSLSHNLSPVYKAMVSPRHLRWLSGKRTYAGERYGLPALWDLLKENYPVQKHKIYLLAVDDAWNEYNWVVERFLDAMPELGIEISGCIMPFAAPDRGEFMGLPRIAEEDFWNRLDGSTRLIIGFPAWCPQTKSVGERYAEHRDILFPIADTANPQYIEADIFPPMEHEIYVDIGVFDLQSSIDFSDWAAKGFDKIYAFEPDPHCYERSLARLNQMDEGFRGKTELIPKGLSSKNGVLEFPAEYNMSGAYDGNMIQVEVVSLDSFLNGRPITLAKMDVEGAEMDVLLGMRETIRTHKPRLEVCIYHKHEDLFTIMSYLLGLVPEYKFYIRHYNSNETETVLFCTI